MAIVNIENFVGNIFFGEEMIEEKTKRKANFLILENFFSFLMFDADTDKRVKDSN